MKKWIIFRADRNQPGWLERKYAHTGSLTKNLFEHIDSSDSELPESGYRPPEFIRTEESASTHYRKSDWEVVRVETYTPDISIGMSFDMIVICYCQYNPINAPLQVMPERQVSIDSFGGDEAKYSEWLNS
jgi:hypothetical protein